jgi:hypothetical protein
MTSTGACEPWRLIPVANDLAPPSAAHPDISGVVVDVPAQGGFATVVGLTDDTTSMYTSTGGGTIGAGKHPDGALRRADF